MQAASRQSSPEPSMRRGQIACRRCRRARSKCYNEGGNPPCRACASAGKADECTFLKGNSVIDRKDAPRKRKRPIEEQDSSSHQQQAQKRPHPDRQASSQNLRDDSSQSSSIPRNGDHNNEDQDSPSDATYGNEPQGQPQYSQLSHQYISPHSTTSTVNQPSRYPVIISPQQPTHQHQRTHTKSISGQGRVVPTAPHGAGSGPPLVPLQLVPVWTVTKMVNSAQLLDVLDIYFNQFYQVGFLHKSSFITKARTSPDSLNPFLISAILALAASACPTIRERFDSGEAANSYFRNIAHQLVFEQSLKPSLEFVQACYLLGLNDWSGARGSRSWLFVGMGIKMARLLRMERTETYAHINEHSPEEDQIAAESSRRTVWQLLIADDSLSCGDGQPESLTLQVTIPMPCDEDDWEFVSIPPKITPDIIGKSLMANIVKVMTLWCRAARRVNRVQDTTMELPPWDPNSEFQVVNSQGKAFHASLHPRLRWSKSAMAAHASRRTDMPFLTLHLSSNATAILLRRMYLPTMTTVLDPQYAWSMTDEGCIAGQPAPNGFWAGCADDAFASAAACVELAQEYSMAPGGLRRGFTPLMGFNVFLAGVMQTYLWRWPWLCPRLAPEASKQANEALRMLADLNPDVHVMAARWSDLLREACATAANPNSSHSDFDATLGGASSTKTIADKRANPLSTLGDLAVTAPIMGHKAVIPMQQDFSEFGLLFTDFSDILPFTQNPFMRVGDQMNDGGFM